MVKSLHILFFLLFAFTSFSQSASPIGPLQVARVTHESQLLPDGQVLVFGGNNHRFSDLKRFSSAELYNPNTKSWSFTGSMHQERDYLASVLLHDGNVLAIGGMDQSSASMATCERYDAATGRWQQASPMATPRMQHAAATLRDGTVLAAGGARGKKSELYDPYDDVWIPTGDMQLEHGAGMAMLLLNNGTVLAMGGELTPRQAEIFNPQTLRWTLLNSFTARRHFFHSMIQLKSGKILIVGTQSLNYSDQVSAELYDPFWQSFSSTGNTATNVGVVRMVMLEDGKVLLYSLGDLFAPTDTKTIQIYDPEKGTWSADKLTYIGAHNATVQMLHEGSILIAGGAWTTGNGASDAGFLYHQQSDAACSPPAVNLKVDGSSVCNGQDATVILPVTERGVLYEAYIGSKPLGGAMAGGGAITLAIPKGMLSPGNNTVKIRASKQGCVSRFLPNTAHIKVELPAGSKPELSVKGSAYLCHGENVEVAGPAGMAGYEWSTGETTQKITVSGFGRYRLRVKDEQGCLSRYSDAFEITTVSGTSTFAGYNESVCSGTSAFALTDFSPLGGSWTGKGVSPEGNFDPAVSGPGEHVLTYTVCGGSRTKKVTVRPVPKVNDFYLEADQETVCYGGYTKVRVMNAEPGVSYQFWMDGKLVTTATRASSFVSVGQVTVRDDTRLIVKGIYASECGSDTLTKEFNFKLFVDPAQPVGTRTPFVCRKNAAQVYVLNSDPGVLYQLKKGNKNIGGPQLGNGDTLFLPTGVLLETSTFSVVGNHNSCTVALKQTVTIDVSGPLAHFAITSHNPEVGEAIEFFNTSEHAGGGYRWSFGPATSVAESTEKDPPPVTFSKIGTYAIKLIATGVEGCRDSLTVKVNVIAPVEETAVNYSVYSSYYRISQVLGVVHDAHDNRYVLYQEENISHLPEDHKAGAYSNRGDSIDLSLSNEPGYNNRHILMKYNAKGTLQWSTQLRHQSDRARGGDLVTDSEGNIYFTYYHYEHVDDIRIYSTDGKHITFDPPHKGNGFYSVVVVKYNKNGLLQWHNNYLAQYNNWNVNLTLDKDFNVYASSDMSLCKFSADGALVWEKKTGYADIETDSEGNVWGVRHENLVVDKYSSDGTLLLSSDELVQVGTKQLQTFPRFMKIDENGNLYVIGEFSGGFAFNQDKLTALNYYRDFFICKINSQGGHRWIRQIAPVSMFTLNGMDLKDGKIVFLGGAYHAATLRYNRLAGNVFANQLKVEQENFIGITDTLAGASVRIATIANSIPPNYSYAHPLIAFQNNTDQVAFATLHNSGQLLGQDIEVKSMSEYQSNQFIFQVPLKTIFPPMAPVSVFSTAGAVCAGPPVQFYDSSLGDPESWEWSFPGASPATSTERNPVVTFTKPGTYQISLTAANAQGAGETFVQSTVIGQVPLVSLPPFNTIELGTCLMAKKAVN
ncbi:PKD domain-containing protein [Pontibacter qinzhouensis]|uniref:PKD domain-containing protein n=1 Tax=Pontibacter qinzhouensis TaxID=2603253 RepID=A0A5C8J1P0_9BACT|nr:PKD domain-containing protein [Pontibacter qinzhouensis]TXK27228.1 PKD domain-containing protein [Pontibacter qinzhouensis]